MLFFPMLNNDFGWHPHSLEPGQKSKLSEFIPDDYNRAFPVRKKAGIFGIVLQKSFTASITPSHLKL